MTSSTQGTPGQVVIECSGLRKTFGALTAVRDVNLSLRRGQVLGLVGPNGAGKTTLMRMLATLLHPTRGEVRVFGHDSLVNPLPARRQIGYLPDFFNLHRDLTLAECLKFYAHAYSAPPDTISRRVRDSLAAAGLLDKQDDFVRHLSRGMVQRLGVAMLMTRDADIMILDEPASGLDPGARVQLRRVLKDLARQGKAILISSHILTEMEDACTDVAIMDRGRVIAEGTVEEIRRRALGGLRCRIRVLGDPAAALAAAQRAGVADARLDEGALTAVLRSEEAVAQLNAALVAGGIQVLELRQMSDLEDVFMRITTGGEVSHEAR